MKTNRMIEKRIIEMPKYKRKRERENFVLKNERVVKMLSCVWCSFWSKMKENRENEIQRIVNIQ